MANTNKDGLTISSPLSTGSTLVVYNIDGMSTIRHDPDGATPAAVDENNSMSFNLGLTI